MVDLRELQKAVYQNKAEHGFNVTDLRLELCLLYGEVNEVFRAIEAMDALGEAGKPAVAEEMADVAIYLLGLAEIAGVDLEQAILTKIEKNRRRRYVQREDGTWEKFENALE